MFKLWICDKSELVLQASALVSDAIITLYIEIFHVKFIVLNNLYRRSCPSKMLFRYINQNDGKRGYTVICIACRTEVHCTSAFQMSQHYHKKCTRHTLGDMNYTDFTTEFDENDESGEIEYTSEDTVSQREIDGQRKLHMNHDVGSLADGFKFKYSSTPSGLRRCAECQQCMKRLGRPFGAKLTAHR